MTDDSSDDRMDELLIHGARDYNAPVAVPREEMWSRIREARTSAARGRKQTTAWVWSSAAVAAAVILAAGIVIGRRMETDSPSRVPPAQAPVIAVKPNVVPPAAHAAAATRDTLLAKLHEQTRQTDRRVGELATASRTSGAGPDTAASDNLAYQLVVLRHLAGSEAMITAFRSTARRGEVDAQMAAWSRELLSTTRTLEATQAADDPVMKRLLEDLDLVITQIVQYSARRTTNPEDLDLIEQSIKKRGVITKLRSTLPGRAFPAGT